MGYRSVGKTSTSWALLLGSAFFTVAAPAATPDTTVAMQAPSVLPPALMLARDWQADLDPSAFLVSEKLDGVRAVWDGQTLRFRSGRRIAAPDWFLAALPATPLDGELWLGRRSFDRLSGMVRRSVAVDAEWRDVRYMIFDLPGDVSPFGERSARLPALVAAANKPWLQAVAQARVADRATLQRLLLQTVNAGGEGLMLHRADALWAPGRSEALRTFKPLPDEDGCFAAGNAGRSALCAGHGIHRRPARRAAAGERLRHLPLSRSHAIRLAAVCEFSTAARGRVEVRL